MRFSGICRGGPYDDKQLEHTAPTFRVMTLPPIEFLRFSEFTPGPDTMKPKVGAYRHVLQQWIWHEEE